MKDFRRDLTVDFEGVGLHDDWGIARFAEEGDKLPRRVRRLAKGFQRVYVPLSPLAVESGNGIDVSQVNYKQIADEDSETLYLFLTKVEEPLPDDISVVYETDPQGKMIYKAYVYENCIFIQDVSSIAGVAESIESGNVCEISEIKRKEREALVENIINMFVGDVEERKETLHNTIDARRDRIASLMNSIRVEEDAANKAQYELYGLDMARETGEEKAQAVLKQVDALIAESPKLKSIAFDRMGVEFVTGKICIENDFGERHKIGGSMRVHVGIPTASVKIENLDNYINNEYAESRGIEANIPHPHVTPQGSPCLGNLAGMLSDACQARDIESIWQLVLSYLQSYNSDDIWGMRLAAFPVDEEGTNMSENVVYESCQECGENIRTGEQLYRCTECGAIMCQYCYDLHDGKCQDCQENEEDETEPEECELEPQPCEIEPEECEDEPLYAAAEQAPVHAHTELRRGI